MRFHKSFVFLTLFLIFFSYGIAQKIVEDIKPEKQFRKLTNYKDKEIYGHLDWTPDGKFIIYARKGEIKKFNLENGKEHIVSRYRGEVTKLRVSPSGNKIAYLLSPLREEFEFRDRIIIQDLDKEKEKIEVIWIEISDFIWCSDEKKLTVCAGFEFGEEMVPFLSLLDIKDRKIERIKELPYACGSIASNYKLGIFGIVGAYIKDVLKLTDYHSFYFFKENQRTAIEKRMSKDIFHSPYIEDIDCKGENVLIATWVSKPTNSRQLVIYNLKKDIVYLLTKEKDDTHLIDPRYSPDCKKIAFFSNRDGAWNIWLLNLEEEHK